MLVGVGVGEPGLDDPGVLAHLDHEAGGDVAEAVEGEVGVQPGPLDRRLEEAGLEGAAKRSASSPDENQIFGVGAAPVFGEVTGQLVDEERRHAQRAPRSAGLGGGDLDDPPTSARVWCSEMGRRWNSTSRTLNPAASDHRARGDRVVSAAWLVSKPRTEFAGLWFAGLWRGSTLAAWRRGGIYRAFVARRAALAAAQGARYLKSTPPRPAARSSRGSFSRPSRPDPVLLDAVKVTSERPNGHRFPVIRVEVIWWIPSSP